MSACFVSRVFVVLSIHVEVFILDLSLLAKSSADVKSSLSNESTAAVYWRILLFGVIADVSTVRVGGQGHARQMLAMELRTAWLFVVQGSARSLGVASSCPSFSDGVRTTYPLNRHKHGMAPCVVRSLMKLILLSLRQAYRRWEAIRGAELVISD